MSDTTALENTPTPAPAPEPEELLLEDDTPAEGDDLDELEIGPTKYKVAKPIKEAWNGLQKTVQAEKEGVKARIAEIEAREAKAAESAKIQAEFIDVVAEIKGIDKSLAIYKDMNPTKWVELNRTDPESYRDHWANYQALLEQRKVAYADAQAKGQAYNEESRKAQAARLAAAERDLPAKIKDWSPAKKEALLKVAQDTGLSPDEVAPFAADWRVMSILDDAAKYRAAVARAASAREAAAKAAKEEQGEPEPVARVKAPSGNSSNVPRDSDPPDVWLKKRMAQVKRR